MIRLRKFHSSRAEEVPSLRASVSTRRWRCRSRPRLSNSPRLSPDFRPIRARDRRFVTHGIVHVLGNVRLTEKGDLIAVAEHEFVVLQVDDGLVAFEHVETEEEVDVLTLHDGEGAGHGGFADGDGGRVNTAQDLGGTDTLGDARVAPVDQAHNPAGFGARGGHDGSLGAGIDEGFDRVLVD